MISHPPSANFCLNKPSLGTPIAFEKPNLLRDYRGCLHLPAGRDQLLECALHPGRGPDSGVLSFLAGTLIGNSSGSLFFVVSPADNT